MPNLTDDQNGSISMAEPEDILETLEDGKSDEGIGVAS